MPLGDGELFAFAFGALVFRDAKREDRDAGLQRLSGLAKRIDCEELVVPEEPGAVSAMDTGVLVVDRARCRSVRRRLVLIVVEPGPILTQLK